MNYTCTEAQLIHGLYHGTPPLGMGFLHHKNVLTVEDVQTEIQDYADNSGMLYVDYFFGHPLKVNINTKDKTFDERLYDRDAGDGAAQKVVDSLSAVG